MTKTEQARELLLKRYPCQELPSGAISDVAREVGCSRNLVSMIAMALGLVAAKGGRRILPRPLCASCGSKMSHGAKSLLCGACKYITVLCAHCESPITMLATRVVLYSSGRYSGLRFCNRTCMAEYRHEHNIGRPRDPNLPHGTSGMYRRGCRCEECRGYWRKQYHKARGASDVR